MPFRRYFFLILLLVSIGVLPATAQTSCTTAAADATTILDSALTLLQAGNTTGATTLITTARDTLATCTAGDAAPTSDNSAQVQLTTDPNPQVQPTATPEPTEADTSTDEDDAPETTGSGDYVLNVPEIDINSSIAFVRFAHTSTDSGAIDIYRERENQPIIAGLDYGEVTELIPIPAGNWLFTARPAGSGSSGDELSQDRWNYIANSSWVITAAGVQETFSFIIEPISIIRNNYDDKARVRFINLAAGAPRTTVKTLEGVVLADGLGWIGLRDLMMDAGEYILDAETTDGAKLVTPEFFEFEANITYTVIVMGGFNGQPLDFLVFETPPEVSRVRFINNRIDVIDVYYRPGNELLISTFDPQTETDWYEFPSGAVTYVAVEAGAGIRSRELAALPWQLRPSRDVTVEITQAGMRVVEVRLRGYGN